MSDIDLDELREKAEAATEGPWIREWPAPDDPYTKPAILEREEYEVVVRADDERETDLADFDFIAAADPATVLALIERLEDAEEALGR